MGICKLTKKKCFRIGGFEMYRKPKERNCNKENIICPYSDGIPEHIRKNKVGVKGSATHH